MGQSVGEQSDTGQILCNRLTCQPKLAHDRSYSFPIRLLSFFTSCFPLSAPFLSLFPPFILFS